jgi:hypothetical protein
MQVAVDDSNPAVSVGVQTWSRGELFPAVISRVETYDEPLSYDAWLAINSQLAHHRLAPSMHRNYLANFYERTLAERLVGVSYRLEFPGNAPWHFATYDGAAGQARYLLADAAMHEAAQLADHVAGVPADLACAWIQNVRPSTTPRIGEAA